MQILERSVFGFRAAEIEFTHSTYPHRFVLLPMVHIAVPEFYDEVNERLSACDHILFEGVQGVTAKLLTTAYKFPAHSKRLGLVLQSQALDYHFLGAKMIRSDISATDFSVSWSRVPFWQRIVIGALAPTYGLFLYLFGTREMVAPSQSTNDKKSRKDILSWGEGFDDLDNAILNDRNRHLCDVIKAHFNKHRDTPTTTAILFGGRHMPAVAKILRDDLGFRNTAAKWRMAIPFV